MSKLSINNRIKKSTKRRNSIHTDILKTIQQLQVCLNRYNRFIENHPDIPSNGYKLQIKRHTLLIEYDIFVIILQKLYIQKHFEDNLLNKLNKMLINT